MKKEPAIRRVILNISNHRNGKKNKKVTGASGKKKDGRKKRKKNAANTAAPNVTAMQGDNNSCEKKIERARESRWPKKNTRKVVKHQQL